jgi:hypothetical protein
MNSNIPEKCPEPKTTDCCMASRQQGKAVIRDLIARLHRRADDLQKLHDMLPEKPTPEQDDALWQIAVSLERP